MIASEIVDQIAAFDQDHQYLYFATGADQYVFGVNASSGDILPPIGIFGASAIESYIDDQRMKY